MKRLVICMLLTFVALTALADVEGHSVFAPKSDMENCFHCVPLSTGAYTDQQIYIGDYCKPMDGTVYLYTTTTNWSSYQGWSSGFSDSFNAWFFGTYNSYPGTTAGYYTYEQGWSQCVTRTLYLEDDNDPSTPEEFYYCEFGGQECERSVYVHDITDEPPLEGPEPCGRCGPKSRGVSVSSAPDAASYDVGALLRMSERHMAFLKTVGFDSEPLGLKLEAALSKAADDTAAARETERVLREAVSDFVGHRVPFGNSLKATKRPRS